jgi:hypothetical protein
MLQVIDAVLDEGSERFEARVMAKGRKVDPEFVALVAATTAIASVKERADVGALHLDADVATARRADVAALHDALERAGLQVGEVGGFKLDSPPVGPDFTILREKPSGRLDWLKFGRGQHAVIADVRVRDGGGHSYIEVDVRGSQNETQLREFFAMYGAKAGYTANVRLISPSEGQAGKVHQANG